MRKTDFYIFYLIQVSSCFLKLKTIEKVTSNIIFQLWKQKDYVMINGRYFFDQTIKNNLRTYDNIHKIAIGQDDHCTTGCLLDLLYFKEYHKLIVID